MPAASLKRCATLAGLLLVLAGNLCAADKETVVWKSIPNAILQVDSKAPKEWNVFGQGKKIDPLLVQIGSRYLVVYVHSMEVYELKPEQLTHKGEELVWRESDKPANPAPTSDWSNKDVGSAQRILLKLAAEGRMLNIEIPHTPDVRRGIY